MTNNIVVLNKTTHKNLRVKANKSFKQSMNQHLSLLQAHEFTSAALYYPIAFVKDGDTGQFLTVAMLGLEPDENLFYSDDIWSVPYVPASLQGYPFLIAPETQSVCVDFGSDLINENEGLRLFNDDGSETEHLKKIKELLSTFSRQTPETRNFINFLTEKKLLTNLTLTIEDATREGGEYQLSGIYAVDNAALNALSNEDFLVLKDKNYLPPIYAHLLSLGCVATMVAKKHAKKK